MLVITEYVIKYFIVCNCWFYCLRLNMHLLHGYGHIKFILLTLKNQLNIYIDLSFTGISVHMKWIL